MKGLLVLLLVLWTSSTQQQDRGAGRIFGGAPSVLTAEAFAPRQTYSFASTTTRSLLLRNKQQQEAIHPSQQRSTTTSTPRRAFGGSNYLDSLGSPPSNDNENTSSNKNSNDKPQQQQQNSGGIPGPPLQQQQPQNSGGMPGPPQQSQQPPQAGSPPLDEISSSQSGSYLDHLQQDINQKAQQQPQQKQKSEGIPRPPQQPQQQPQAGSPLDGIASFQSGSYLDNLQQGGKNSSKNDSSSSEDSSAKRMTHSGTQNMSSGSYLDALGKGSRNVSPWDRQQMNNKTNNNNNSNNRNGVAPWRHRPDGPKFLPVPQTPREFSAPPAVPPAASTQQQRPEQQFAAPPSPAPEEESSISSSSSISQEPPATAPEEPPAFTDEPATVDATVNGDSGDSIINGDDEDRTALLDMLDSTRDVYDDLSDAYYENLAGDMIEGEGVVIPRQQLSDGDDDSENRPILEDLVGDDEIVVDALDDEEPDNEGEEDDDDDDDANEPIYLDSLYENDDDNEPIVSLDSTGRQDTVEPKQELTPRQQSGNMPFFGNLAKDSPGKVSGANSDDATSDTKKKTGASFDKDSATSEKRADDTKSVPVTDKNIGAGVVAANTEPAAPWWSSPPPSDVTTAAAPKKEDTASKDQSGNPQQFVVAASSADGDDAALAWEFNEVSDAAMEAADSAFMRMAVDLASTEECVRTSYPNPTVGAVLVADDGSILGKAFSSFRGDAIRSAIEAAGLELTAQDGEWIDTWPSSGELREKIASSTLYVTLEPNKTGRGSASPPITQLIEQIGIPRVVIGSANPVPERTLQGAAALQAAGISVNIGRVMREECDTLIEEYDKVANGRLRRMARKHFKLFGRPLGFLHCSVVDSDNVEAFARHGNAFGTDFGGKQLSYRNFGSYELAPPPDVVWADDGAYEDDDDESIFSVDFDDEDYQEILSGTPVMPYYEQVDAVVATFPRPGNGPPDDDSVAGRLAGLRWLATHGCNLPPGVERVLVLDATDLKDLPLKNGDPNLPPGFDIEAFWRGANRKQTRIILRRAGNDAAQAAAKAAAKSAAQAAEAAAKAAAAIDSGDVAACAQAAIECQEAAFASVEFVQKELEASTELRRQFEAKGVKVEAIDGGEPIDIMKFLGEQNGHRSVVWRAGCWGERGVRAILEGAFQMVSAHLAVPAIGGRFWQLMIAENAVQAACGPQSKVKIFADQEDISLEYCDNLDVDEDCVLSIDGKPVRHVRLDCRVALVDADRPREFDVTKTQKITRNILTEEAPWFL